MENSELITKALGYIGSAYKQNEISPEDVAFHAGFSTDYFNRIFFAHTGFCVMEYVRFTRLKNAARLLRIYDRDILTIALECGYDSHESFSRAFKKQYGLTPSEYRKKYEATEAVYGDFFNETIAARLTHEFTDLKIADPDEVIDWLLETDALKYGYPAVCFHYNGGAALYTGEDFRNGFIWFTEWDGKFEGEIISSDFGKISEYLKLFSDDRFDMIVYTELDDDALTSGLTQHGFTPKTIDRHCFNVYTGQPYEITPPEGYSVKLLRYEDYDIVKKHWEGSQSASHRIVFLERELYQRDVLGNDEHSCFIFGIFKDGKMVGTADGGLQRTHGFVVNNCVATSLREGHRSEELYEYVFKYVTNAALEKGALPVDDIQTPYYQHSKSGSFDSTDFGYRTVMYSCGIK